MNFVKQIERMQLLNKLIIQRNTGTPEELAERIGVSRRKLYDLIEDLNCWGAKVAYDRKSQTFYYRTSFELDIQFSLKVIKEGESKKIFGGGRIFSFPCIFSAQKEHTLDFRLTS